MHQIVIDTASIFPLLWAFFAGLILGGLWFYSLGRRRGLQDAVQEKNRADTARAFAEYINDIARRGRRHGSTVTQED